MFIHINKCRFILKNWLEIVFFTRIDTFNKLGYKAEINNYTASCIN